MALQKQAVPVNFAKGLDTKSDSYQVSIGSFLTLVNSVFTTGGRLTKRNGFDKITTIPSTTQTTLTTLNDNLIATGSNLYAYSQDTDQWLNRGPVQPVSLNVKPLLRASTGQSSPDAAIAPNGLACVVYVDNGLAYYQVSDSATGQQIVSRTALPATATNPRAFILGSYFIITFTAIVAGNGHLQYIPIPINLPAQPGIPSDISTSIPSLQIGYDCAAVNNTLYVAYADTGNTIKITYISSTLILQAPAVITGHTASLMSVAIDPTASTAVIYATFWDNVSNNGYVTAISYNRHIILAPVQIITNTVINELTSSANNQLLTVIYENQNTYTYAPNAKTDFLSKVTVTLAGAISQKGVILRSVGLGSKSFIAADGTIYMLAAYGETNQPTYFLINSNGQIIMRLAYANGGGYAATQVLPSVTPIGDMYLVPYLIKDFLVSTNKMTGASTSGPIYTQTGINLATFGINNSGQYSSEIASTLHLTGGQLWMYDGVRPVEHGFQVWPENIALVGSGAGGNLSAQQYYYQVTYEWTDNQGNLHRSAPSIPAGIVTSGSTSSVTLNIPTLRLTYKVAPNPVRIVVYRWSVAQQVYYQASSITSPVINNPGVDSVTFVDTLADSAIIGNPIIYTTGGVIEDIAAPASTASVLFKNRLFLVDAEDQNLLWFSKVVIEAVPVEMSDLLTVYIAPTSGAQGSTGPITALSAMDDKLIIFKRDAIYYITGAGPDNTGAQNDFSDPIYVTSSVGCANPNSIVLMPTGIMFQSDKGIWLLGRDLSTQYIGAPVEAYNTQTVSSAVAVPGTNQVRFILTNNITLMYDYYYAQWGTFTNIRAISSHLYKGLHTYLNSFGQVLQEQQGMYLDDSNPVLMSFTTSWIAAGGLQGYERFYELFLLGTYLTPFTLNVGMGYDYNSSPSQAVVVTPDNYSGPWGAESVWGAGGGWGGPGNVFEARVFPEQQKCESFQITVEEVYDPSLGVAAGAGLTLSGLEMVIGIKKGYRTTSAAKSFG
jgi:hypothetical protein